MGLIYLFPVDLNEQDHVEVVPHEQKLVLRSYGLPSLFWIYFLLGILLVIFPMIFLARPLLQRLIMGEDSLNIFIGQLTALTLIMVPVGLLVFFFYEKNLIRMGPTLITIRHKVFFVPVWKKSYQLNSNLPFEITQFKGTPNMARETNDPTMGGYMNKGYFQLWGFDVTGKKFLIDRCNQKRDLEKLIELLKVNFKKNN
jgi:hypothetical protein